MGDRSGGGYASRGRFQAKDDSREEAPRGYGRRDDRQGQGRGDWRSRRAPGRADTSQGDGGERTSWRDRGSTTTRASTEMRTPPMELNGDTDEISEKLVALKLTETVRGECEAMCSSEEVKMRQLTKDLSRFEISPGSSLSSALKADQLPWAVKKYRRPAAGRIEIQPQELRPPHVLEKTLQHLFTNVLPWKGCGFDWSDADADADADTLTKSQDFLALYHFVSDRVRSVRQDFVIQRVSGLSRIQALMQTARFYVLASFRATQILDFGDKTIDWSETLNDQQLASALTEVQAQFQSMESTELLANEALLHLQEEALALDVLLHLPDAQAVSLLLVKASRSSALLKRPGLRRVLALFVAFQTGDFFSFSRCFRQLPELQRCLALRHLVVLWPRTLTVMNKAYGKIDRFTLDEIATTLELSSSEDSLTLCKALNVHVDEPAVESTPSASVDSWEETTATEPPRAQAFVQFKISAMHDELEKPVEWGLVRRRAASIQKTFATRYTTTELVCSRTTWEAN